VKVLMVSKALVVGAYQRKLEEIARRPEIELTVVLPDGWREGVFGKVTRLHRVHTQGYRLITAPLRFNGQFHLHYYPTLPRLLAELQPDVFHMDEEPYNLATWLALRAASRHDIASLFFTWQNLERRYPWPFRHFEQASYGLARHAIAGNPTAGTVLQQKGYRGDISVIPQFGVDPDLFSPAPERSAGRHSQFVVGYAGRLAPEKGVDLLLKACAGLKDIGWTLQMLGDGPQREPLGHLAAALGIADRVVFLGKAPSTEVVDYYRQFDVLVLPSISRPNWVEQFGRVLIEAMACGVPVVGSDSGEIPWVIGDAGMIYPEGNVEALTAVLRELSLDPERRHELAQRGRSRVLARFTQVQVAEATVQVYRRMVDRRGH
jgi:glycosyltransferase involved in cell wall biosynthesis